jgi:tellurite resistance protein TehA-like permease
MEQDSEAPDTVVLDGSPNVSEGDAPEQIYVQAGQFRPGEMPTTNATVALILSIVGLVMCGLCTAIPGLILANGALEITKQYPTHPDAGIAKGAQIVGWITIVIWILIILLYVVLFGFVGLAMWSEGA